MVASIATKNGIAALPLEAASLDELERMVSRAKGRIGEVDRNEFAVIAALADQRRLEIRVHVIRKEIAALDRYPDELSSLDRIGDRRGYVARVVGRDAELPEFEDFDRAASYRAAQIAAAALPRFRAKLTQAPGTFEGARLVLKGFREIEPSLEQVAPTYLSAYETVAFARIDAIFELLTRTVQKQIRSPAGRWRDVPGLIELAQTQAAVFDDTLAQGGAATLVEAITVRASEIAKNDIANFQQELSGIEDTWAGLEKVSELSDLVASHQRQVSAFEEYARETVTRRAEILDTLSDAARRKILATGKTYRDVAMVLEAGDQHGRQFENANAPRRAALLRQIAETRASAVVDEYFPVFEVEIAELETTRQKRRRPQFSCG